MSKYSFNDAERYSVWTAHAERCWICGETVPYSAVEIDHIIPESLLGSDRLSETLRAFGLPADFDLNSWSNWMPADRHCNGAKRERIFKPSPLIQLNLEKASDKAARAAQLCESFTTDRVLSIAIARIEHAAAQGKLPDKVRLKIEQLIYKRHDPNREPERRGEPLFLTPGMTIVHEDESRYIIRGRTGLVGMRPKGDRLDPSWDCPNCGPTSWNGTRCTNCGYLVDTD